MNLTLEDNDSDKCHNSKKRKNYNIVEFGNVWFADMSGTVQAYQIATSGALPQGVVMATAGSAMSSPQNLSEEASRKRELRLLKNR